MPPDDKEVAAPEETATHDHRQEVHQPEAPPTRPDAGKSSAEGLSQADVLEALRFTEAEAISICWQRDQEQPTQGQFTTAVMRPSEVPGFIARTRDERDGVWFGACPLATTVTTGRGKESDVTRLSGLWADLDVKGGGWCPDLEATITIIEALTKVIGEPPALVTFSGHGTQPIWPLDPASAVTLEYPGEAKALLVRWGMLVKRVAGELGYKVDGVFDLTRVLRVPGSVNSKGGNQIRVECVHGGGQPLTVERIRAVLDAEGIPERPGPSPSIGTTNGHQKPHSDPGTWQEHFEVNALTARVQKATEGARNRTIFGAAKDAARQGEPERTFRQIKRAAERMADPLEDFEIDQAIRQGREAGDRDREEREWAHRQGTDDDAAFWEKRLILAHIRDYARANRVSPWATLGAVMRRAICAVNPLVKLPGLVGAPTSINFFTVTTGAPGQGKDAADEAANHAITFTRRINNHRGDDGLEAIIDPEPSQPGTGEGLARIFKGRGQSQLPQHRVHLKVRDVATLEALASRQGHTLVSQLLAAYMGQELGFNNNSAATSTAVRAHSYRLCLNVGAQPENARLFLDREKDGFPHRFVWLPSDDPYAPNAKPDAVDPVTVVLPEFVGCAFVDDEGNLLRDDDGRPVEHLVAVPGVAREAVDEHRVRVLRKDPDVNPLDGHLMVTRLKVAFALALLDGRGDITGEDWGLAGYVIARSTAVRNEMKTAAAESADQENRGRAEAQAKRQILIDDRLTKSVQDRVWKAITRKLHRASKATRRELQRACDSKLQRDFAAVFDSAVDQGKLVAAGGDGSDMLYRLKTQPWS